ncbi:MAG: Hpt domain-containing protein [Magnetococcales bacterium]|nr:Hpt domain-containing protein [Magnetococcales bacterium]
MTSGPDKVVVRIDHDLEEIVPGYLKNRWNDVEAMRNALKQGDFESLRVLGHRMKGSGAGYGFDAITEIGRGVENAAKTSQAGEIAQGIQDLVAYLERVEVVYE